jgi:DHA2 family multidrug resistance protein-like MFS transporter
VDPLSIVLSMATMVPIVYAIKEAAAHGPSPLVAALVVAGVGFGVLFVRRQRRSETPMLDVRLFARGAFSGALLVNLLSVLALVGFIYFVSQHLQLIVGLSPMNAGLALVPGLVLMIVSGLAVVPVAKRVSPRVVIPVALVFSFAGYVMVALSTDPGAVALLVVAFMVLGIGIGAAETVSNELVLASAPPAKAGAASAVSETAYEVGAVLGTTILGGILTAMYRTGLDLPSGLPQEAAGHARDTLAGAVHAADEMGGAIGEALRSAAASAFDAGVTVTAVIGAAFVVLAAVVAAVTLGKSRASEKK